MLLTDRKVLNEFLSEIIASDDQALREDEPVTADRLRELWSAQVRPPPVARGAHLPYIDTIFSCREQAMRAGLLRRQKRTC